VLRIILCYVFACSCCSALQVEATCECRPCSEVKRLRCSACGYTTVTRCAECGDAALLRLGILRLRGGSSGDGGSRSSPGDDSKGASQRGESDPQSEEQEAGNGNGAPPPDLEVEDDVGAIAFHPRTNLFAVSIRSISSCRQLPGSRACAAFRWTVHLAGLVECVHCDRWELRLGRFLSTSTRPMGTRWLLHSRISRRERGVRTRHRLNSSRPPKSERKRPPPLAKPRPQPRRWTARGPAVCGACASLQMGAPFSGRLRADRSSRSCHVCFSRCDRGQPTGAGSEPAG
jgi:hypothetical protein